MSSSTYLVRRLRMSDVPQLQALALRSARLHLSAGVFMSSCLKKYHEGFVVEYNHSVVAALTGHHDASQPSHIDFICVDQNFRRQGLATKLIYRFVEACDQGNVSLEVRKSNLVAHKLYESLGFHDTGINLRNIYFSDDSLVMTRPGSTSGIPGNAVSTTAAVAA